MQHREKKENRKEKLEEIKPRLKEHMESPVGKENAHAEVIHRELAKC